jgi:ABC-type multidrug transport system ATPase subunit
MIQVVGVTQHYGIKPVLRGVTLSLKPARLVAIVGPNGMGKSTLLGVLAGTLSPQKGYIEIDGLRRRRSEEEELAVRRRVVYLPDRPWLPKEQTGREFLLAVGTLYAVETERRIAHAERLLNLFQLARHADSPIRGYSNGQKKKIAIASALIAETPVLLLDEPFAGGLDPAGIFALKRLLRWLCEHEQRTVVMTAPVAEIVDEIADEVIVIRDGEVLAHDTVAGLRERSGCTGSLADVLQKLTQPEVAYELDQYFQEFPS